MEEGTWELELLARVAEVMRCTSSSPVACRSNSARCSCTSSRGPICTCQQPSGVIFSLGSAKVQLALQETGHLWQQLMLVSLMLKASLSGLICPAAAHLPDRANSHTHTFNGVALTPGRSAGAWMHLGLPGGHTGGQGRLVGKHDMHL